MLYRHLHSTALSSAAIDDIIERGSLSDWLELRDAARGDPETLTRIARICERRAQDRFAQRFHFWKLYAASRRAAA